MLLKKIILTFISIGLLWGFQASAYSDFLHENSAIFDTSSDSEIENHDSENWKFVNNNSTNLEIPKLSLRIKKNNELALLKDYFAVPTSPPNTYKF